MRIESPYLTKNSKPGQFVEIKISDGIEPLLRRPLGVHRILKNGIDLLYAVVGKGTETLSKKKAGEEIDLIGPLGNGFDIAASTKAAILVAGGIGVAPLLALAEHLGYRSKGVGCRKKILVLIGACKKEHILCENDFKKLGCKVVIATDDGSKGHKGFVTDLLNTIPTAYSLQPTTIYACGPAGMLKTVSKVAREKRIPCQVSLEERMACGVGVCLGCPVKVKSGEYKMVCKDGPVFDAEEIAW